MLKFFLNSIIKLLNFLFFSAILIILTTSCKNYNASLEEFLEYWSATFYIKQIENSSDLIKDASGYYCIPTTADATIKFSVHNPTNLLFTIPDKNNFDLISFSENIKGINGNKPQQGIDYVL